MTAPTRNINEWANSGYALILGGGAMLIGALLMGSSQGPTNLVMREIAPLHVWGAGFLTAGVLGIAGQITRRPLLILTAHGLGFILAGAVAACFYVAANHREISAGLHGVGVYLLAAVLHLFTAVVSRPPR